MSNLTVVFTRLILIN